jgi:16S rRNA (cytidine1402-2'-O)-methyltransferase
MSDEVVASGTLHVVGTPIGNLEDITLRALEVLARVRVIAAEDTRVTARLCARHEIDTPRVSLREQNASRVVPRLIATLEGGDDVALVTDAGTPSVSDPGVDLVAAAAKRNLPITPVPGPSALSTALSVAGLRGDGVRFLGFLPRGGRRRRERVEALSTEAALAVLYEAPGRLARTLAELAECCGEREAVVLRELTKVHEEIARGSLPELAARFDEKTLGEVTLVIAGASPDPGEEISDERLGEIVRRELDRGRSARVISAALAGGLGIPRKRIYRIAVEIASNLQK